MDYLSFAQLTSIFSLKTLIDIWLSDCCSLVFLGTIGLSSRRNINLPCRHTLYSLLLPSFDWGVSQYFAIQKDICVVGTNSPASIYPAFKISSRVIENSDLWYGLQGISSASHAKHYQRNLWYLPLWYNWHGFALASLAGDINRCISGVIMAAIPFVNECLFYLPVCNSFDLFNGICKYMAIIRIAV